MVEYRVAIDIENPEDILKRLAVDTDHDVEPAQEKREK